jgi:hypothetical protein
MTIRLEIEFEDKNGSRVHNWDPTRSKIQEGSGKNYRVLECPNPVNAQAAERP